MSERGSELENPKEKTGTQRDPDPNLSVDPDTSSDPDNPNDPGTPDYQDPMSDPTGPSRKSDIQDPPGETISSEFRWTQDQRLIDPSWYEILPAQPESGASTDRRMSPDTGNKLLEALNLKQPDQTKLTQLLDGYEQALRDRASPRTRQMPERYAVLTDTVANCFPDPEQSAEQKAVVGAVNVFSKSLYPPSDRTSFYSKQVPELNETGTNAIKVILGYVKKVFDSTSGRPPNHLTTLLGVAERIGRTVIEAQTSKYAWSITRCDYVASTDSEHNRSYLRVTDAQLAQWDVVATYKQTRDYVIKTAEAREDTNFARWAETCLDRIPTEKEEEVYKTIGDWARKLGGQTSGEREESTNSLVVRLSLNAYRLENPLLRSEAKLSDTLKQTLKQTRGDLQRSVRENIRLIVAAMAYRLRNLPN